MPSQFVHTFRFLSVTVLALLSSCTITGEAEVTVPSGYVGVLSSKYEGELAHHILQPGEYVVNNAEPFGIYPIETKTTQFDAELNSSDGHKIQVTYEIAYNVIESRAVDLHDKIGENYSELLPTSIA